MSLENIKRFADFADEELPLDGDKCRLDDILNCEIIITGYRITSSRYTGKNKSGKCLTVQFRTEAQEICRVFFTGSDVLIRQMEKYAKEIPFLTTVKKVDRFYTFA